MALSYVATALDIRFDIAAAAPGVNPFAARGLSGTLAPIALAQGDDKLARTVNGTLISLAAPQMRKYRLEVSGDDQAPPALDGVWVGMQVAVDAHVELAYLTAGGTPGRTPVSGSGRVEGDYTYYRPHFDMRIIELEIQREEWNAAYSFSLVLEEI
jgi:hypothetical protein